MLLKYGRIAENGSSYIILLQEPTCCNSGFLAEDYCGCLVRHPLLYYSCAKYKAMYLFITLLLLCVHNLCTLHKKCAKTEGESCGDLWGTCVPGFYCDWPKYGSKEIFKTGPQKGKCKSKIYIIYTGWTKKKCDLKKLKYNKYSNCWVV